MRRWPLMLLLALAACNRGGVADVTLDADAAQRNATAAKTESDLAAALAASKGPVPVIRDVPAPTEHASKPDKARQPRVSAPVEEDIGSTDAADEVQSND